MSKIVDKQMIKTLKKENKILSKKPNQFLQKNISPTIENLENKIPQGLRETMDVAFSKAFLLVFEKGTILIEKTYRKDKISIEHEMNNLAFERSLSRFSSKKYLKNIDKIAGKSRFLGKSVAVFEGASLGILGIGIPDIPIFISVILKGIYEIATSYGFEYQSTKEKIYILKLIQAAMSQEQALEKANYEVEMWVKSINAGIADSDLNTEINKTSKILSEQMLLAKFVQGIPIVGVAGSVFNLAVYNKISNYVSLKYKKRYLQRKSDFSID